MRSSAGVGLVLVCMLAGCHVDEHKNGDNKDVKIETPFGGVQVKTNDAAAPSEIGIAIYPGAVPTKKDNGNDDNSAADINMSFGSFHLKVQAASYRTDDPPAKVEAFYRDGLRHYGTVIACRNNAAVGVPAQTDDGLTCDNTHGAHWTKDKRAERHGLELKAGSQQHQHLVTIDPDGNGTKIGLVALDLPGNGSSEKGGGDRE